MSGAEVDALFPDAPRIGLEEVGDADLQSRVDRKYVLPIERLAELARGLGARHALLRVDGLTSFAYRSAYLDTPDLMCFHAHRQGRRLRWKARTRLYIDSGRCRFEVKLKNGRGDTEKHALLVPAEAFGTVPAQARAFLGTLLAQRYGHAAPELLTPSLLVSHRRSTLVDRRGNSRVTLDSVLRFGSAGSAAAGLRDRLVLVETKSADGRSPADLLLRAAGVRPVSVSKYSAGVALTRRDQPDQPWRPLLSRHFTAELAA